MNGYLNYFIEANIGLLLFLAAYMLLLRNETDFQIKRGFLLIGIFTSITFPLLHIQYGSMNVATLSRIIPPNLLPQITITGDQAVNQEVTQSRGVTELWFYLQIVYAAGLIFLAARFIARLFSLLRTINTSNPAKVGKLKIVEYGENHATFSFFNFIVLGQAKFLSSEEKQKIIKHEAVHASQFHSFDILLLNLISIFFWVNPFLKSYKKIFVQLHEFEADARAVENRDVNEYCNLLARVALTSAGVKLANHFNNSLTVKRIEMMRTIKKKIKPWKILAAAGIIPLAFFFIACQDQISNEVAKITKESTMAVDIPAEVQRRYDELLLANPEKKFLLMETDADMKPKLDEMKAEFEQLDQSQISHIELITPTVADSKDVRTFAIVEYTDQVDAIVDRSKLDDDVFTMVEETATPQGGMPALFEHIGQKLVYPAQARRMGVEGSVFVEFVVQTDGSVSDVRIKKGIGAGCDEAALIVVKTSPKWNPGKNKGVPVKQRLVLPIAFSLGGPPAEDKTKAPENSVDEIVVVGEADKN
ncbi:MAG TPA: M56 family metallopeptidase [Chryseolinea sp.]